MKTVEIFNTAKLQCIIDNIDISDVTPLEYGGADYKTVLKSYVNTSFNDKQIVYYNQIGGKGRYFANMGLSMQNLKRNVRHTIADGKYVDIDMVNAHPVILSFLCHKNDFECKYLDEYIANREKLLTDTGLDREIAKKQYLILTNSNGTDIEPATNHMFRYSTEMIKLHKSFYDLNKSEADEVAKYRIRRGKTDNHKAAYMNHLLCDTENIILMEMFKFFGKPENCVLCFDGIMLPEGGDYNLVKCMEHIKRTVGIDIMLKFKPMSEVIDLSKYKLTKRKKRSLRYWSDMKHLIGKKVYKETVDEWVNNCISLINKDGSLCYALKKSEGQSTICNSSDFSKTMSSFNCSIINPSYDNDFAVNNPKSKDLKAKKFIYSNLGYGKGGYIGDLVANGEIPTYYDIDYIPYMTASNKIPMIDTDMYNTFEKFPCDTGEISKVSNFENSLWYNHLKNNFFNNVGEFEHFLDTIADMIQDPINIKDNAHLFYSRQGCGKGLIGEFMTRLLGRSNVAVFNNTDLYFTSRFNVDSSNKILKLFEEVSEKGQAFSNHNRLKAEITAKEERIEKKGIDPFTVKNCARYWFFTNNESTLYIENDDRRFTLHKIECNKIGDIEYFKPIAEEIKDDVFINDAFQYFAKRTYDEIHVRTAYETDYKTKEKFNNLPNGIKFIIEWIEDNVTSKQMIENEEVKKTLSDLTTIFKDWCTEAGIRYNAASLKTQIKKIGLEPSRMRHNGERVQCISFTPIDIQTTIREFIKMPYWSFDIEGYDDKPTSPLSDKLFNDQSSESSSNTIKQNSKVKKDAKVKKGVKKTNKLNLKIKFGDSK